MLPNELDFESVLAELARGNVVAEGTFEDVLHFLIKRAAETLAVRRVSFWLFDDQHRKLVCSSVYDSADGTCCRGEELLADDYPLYFSALEKMRTIAAIDAENDPLTVEMRETYLRPHRIKTMLDAPIFLNGEVIGVVCHEQSDLKREWTDAEKSFAGSIADFISLALEANHRIEAERKLSETEGLLGTVTEQMSDGFCLLEPMPETHEFIVRYVNSSGAEMNGYTYDELVGQSSSIFRVPGHYVDLNKFMLNGKERAPIVFETLTQRKNRTAFPVEISLNKIQHQGKTMLAVIGRDITSRQAAEEMRIENQARSLQAERLASLGMLAGKIAHDFNNLLVGIVSNVSLATLNLPPEHKAGHYLANIESTAQMAADLCNQLLIYSGKQRFEMRNVDLSELVEQMSSLLSVSLPPNVTLQNEIDNFLPPIAAEPTQIRQILLNLITNAADAIREKGGTIKIETSQKILNSEDLEQNRFEVQAANFAPDNLNQNTVCLRVTDDGEGMTAETRKKMFEPFFTTKDTGRGLGMATLAGIVRAHGGAITVESEPGRGTTMSVWFPASNQ